MVILFQDLENCSDKMLSSLYGVNCPKKFIFYGGQREKLLNIHSKIIAEDNLFLLLYFSEKMRLDISSELSLGRQFT